MYKQAKSSSGISLIPLETSLLANRTIFLEGEINHETACRFLRQLMVLCQEGTKPIKLLINSPGGEIQAGMLIYDSIQGCAVPIQMYCVGRAYSMGAVLFASGRHGRYILPNSEVMLHEPLLGNRVSGNASSIRSISESLLQVKQKLNGILVKHSGRSEQEIEAATSYDHYFSADEAINFGIADCIITFDQIMKEET